MDFRFTPEEEAYRAEVREWLAANVPDWWREVADREVGEDDDIFPRLREWHAVRAIGEVHEVHIYTNRPIWRQGDRPLLPAQEVPEHLDWNLWQGVAAERPYNGAYVPLHSS